jgi:transposase
MERIPYGKYNKEFREEAVKLVLEDGLSVLEAGRRLSLVPSTKSYTIKEEFNCNRQIYFSF